MPKLIRFVIVNSAIGVLIGWGVAFAMMWFNVNGLGQMYMHAEHQGIIAFILMLSFGVTFGFAYLTTAVMMIPTDKDEFDKL
ncbi:MAG: hypothetical protein MUC58_08750 [Rhizobiaceae bacterium]|nr:hypothetical protein [Rhizobiaceae bacterium]